MAEALTPNAKHRLVPVASRLQSPTSPFFLGSNDDKLERAQARAARAAASRRKSVAVAHSVPPQKESDPCFDKHQIIELFQNCIKLASENKINQKNTWDLNLIDHLSEIVKVEEESDTETNFQKASCTLEAGVKIYASRVDSVHSEAYKVLGGINRTGQETEQDPSVEDNVGSVEDEGNRKKETERKLSPLSTLEASFESLNVKKFDVAFAVDPLYHQTSAQFDEGGAKGLLLNNLGVYGGCQVLFDSQEVPGKLTSSENWHDNSETIDLSFAREYVEQMVLNMWVKDEISPSLRTIVDQFDEDNRRPSDAFSCTHKFTEQVDEPQNGETRYEDDGGYDDSGDYAFDHEHQPSVADGDPDTNDLEPTFPDFHEDVEQSSFQDLEMNDRSENVGDYLFLSLGFSPKQNAWAGPDHWKYRKTKGPENHGAAENESSEPAKRTRKKKQAETEIEFTKASEAEMPDIFAPPKNPKSLLLPANRTPCNSKLPEDCHYQPENLVKLFLLPNVMCLGRRRRKLSDERRQQYGDFEPAHSWDEENGFDGPFDDEHDQTDMDDGNSLVSQPRQVNKIDVQYDKTSKQVDVQVLKETLWDHIQESPQTLHRDHDEDKEEEEEKPVSFKQLLSSFPSDCQAAGTLKEISPHLCFICLLHLANEHGLRINGSQDLDDLSIHLPGRK